MKISFLLCLTLIFSSLCLADSSISDLELGVLSCIERTTNLGEDSSNPEKAKIVNAIFKEIGIKAMHDDSKHSNVRGRYKLKDADAYSEGYSACDNYIYKIDPEGTKYTNYE
jgi:hypothetical protein